MAAALKALESSRSRSRSRRSSICHPRIAVKCYAALQSLSSPLPAASAMKFKFCACALDALCRSSRGSSNSSGRGSCLTPSGGNFPLEEKNCSALPGVAVVFDVVVDVVESAVRAAWGALPLRRGPLGKSTTALKPVEPSRAELCLVLPGSINSWKSRCWRLIRPLPGHAFCHFLVLRTQQRQTEAPQRGSYQWVAAALN